MNASLLEVLISLSLLSIVILGEGALQLSSSHNIRTSYYMSVATEEINNITTLLHHLPTVDLADSIINWQEHVAKVLPQGKGVIEREGSHYDVSIFWGGATPGTCPTTQPNITGCLHYQNESTRVHPD